MQESNVKLLCNANFDGAKYTALSYCWGGRPFINTTTETLEARKECIKWVDPPKTFQQAIIITRKLGVRYIWIDSLCVLQDEIDDWEFESSRMCSVYENSYLTIAASHASDSNGGCFHETKGVGMSTFLRIGSSSNFSDAYARWGSDSKALSSRGWALQERLLSPRTIHYTAKELVWECSTGLDCQCGGIHVFGAFDWSKRMSSARNDVYWQIHNWTWIVAVHSSQNLTIPADRLPALSGLAPQVLAPQAQREGWGQYAAGLWRNGLEMTTCWELANKEKAPETHPEYLGPSWSWVNIRGGVNYPLCIKDGIRRKDVQSLVELKDVRVSTGSDPTGRVFGASMLVSGRSVNATLSPNPAPAGGGNRQANRESTS
ncbi:MAG: hypothetical protein M1818_003042 [Claussenomyces sp. TS43310]|nr:MAG: hypothetical protein M1818_003042 [Claussenomyces sp. TS43310]